MRKIISFICVVAVVFIPTVFGATGTESTERVKMKQLEIIRQLESSQKLASQSQQEARKGMEEWELYCSDEMHDGYRDKTTGRKIYEFFSGTAVLEGMMDHNVYDRAAAKELAQTAPKSEEELLRLAKACLTEVYGEDFNNYTYESIEYWESEHLYHVTFWHYIEGFKIDDPIGIVLTADGEIASYDARERGVYDNFTFNKQEVAQVREALLAEATQRWQCPMEILDYFLMYDSEGQKVAVLTVLFDSPEAENMKWTDWLTKPIC